VPCSAGRPTRFSQAVFNYACILPRPDL
jgi:hypothetical protein